MSFCLFIHYTFFFFWVTNDIDSQIPPSLEMSNLRQELVGHKRWVLPFQSIFSLDA